MDADLIMLSLNHLKYSKQIYLYRETPHFIKSLDNSLDPEQTYLINILDLKYNHLLATIQIRFQNLKLKIDYKHFWNKCQPCIDCSCRDFDGDYL